MCGPSKEEKGIAGQQSNLSNTLSSHFNERFGQQSQILQNLNSMLTPIAEAGPDQQGFGANELAALHTQAGEGVGANYSKATQALQNTLAARGGGNEALPTGARSALQGNLASAAANQMSQEELGITRANYAQGRQNWQEATHGLSSLANQYDPSGYASGAQSGYSSAFGMEHTINQEQSQKEMAIASGISSLAMGAATFGAGALEGGQGFDFQGGLSALSGKG